MAKLTRLQLQMLKLPDEIFGPCLLNEAAANLLIPKLREQGVPVPDDMPVIVGKPLRQDVLGPINNLVHSVAPDPESLQLSVAYDLAKMGMYARAKQAYRAFLLQAQGREQREEVTQKRRRKAKEATAAAKEAASRRSAELEAIWLPIAKGLLKDHPDWSDKQVGEETERRLAVPLAKKKKSLPVEEAAKLNIKARTLRRKVAELRLAKSPAS